MKRPLPPVIRDFKMIQKTVERDANASHGVALLQSFKGTSLSFQCLCSEMNNKQYQEKPTGRCEEGGGQRSVPFLQYFIRMLFLAQSFPCSC